MHRHVSFVHVLYASLVCVGCNGPCPEATFPSITPNTEVEFAKIKFFFRSLRWVSMFVQMYNGIQAEVHAQELVLGLRKKKIEK